MGRPKKKAPRTEQVNFKLTRAHSDMLEAIAFVEEKAQADVARTVVEEYVERRAQEPLVEQVLDVRRKTRGEP